MTMAHVSEFRPKANRDRYESATTPEVEQTAFSPALTAVLATRVRVILADGTHWMSGYEALSSELRERESKGDSHATVLLGALVRYGYPVNGRKAPLPTADVSETPEERELARAFIKRTVEANRARSGNGRAKRRGRDNGGK